MVWYLVEHRRTVTLREFQGYMQLPGNTSGVGPVGLVLKKLSVPAHSPLGKAVQVPATHLMWTAGVCRGPGSPVPLH